VRGWSGMPACATAAVEYGRGRLYARIFALDRTFKKSCGSCTGLSETHLGRARSVGNRSGGNPKGMPTL
jgi:hypothetical protein